MWPGQLASEAYEGLLDVFTPICSFPINILKGAKAAAAHRSVKTGCGMWWPRLCGMWWPRLCGMQESVSLTHAFVAEPAKLLGRTPDCLNGCHDGCKKVIFLIF